MTTSRDRLRQWSVLLSAVIAIVGSFIGSGAAGGTPIQLAAGGALGADATPIAPAVPAFSIWAVIYTGLIALAIWQFLPKYAADSRQRQLGFPVAASLILNAAWILSIQFDQLALSVPVIGLLLASLIWAFRICARSKPNGRLEGVIVDGTIGLYLGWVCVATAANVTAYLVALGFRGAGVSADVWAVAIIAVAGAVGVALAIDGRGRISPALSLSWGLAWVAVSRLTGTLISLPAAVASIVAVVVILATTITIRIVSGKALPA